MKDKDVIWITKNGKRIPIKKEKATSEYMNEYMRRKAKRKEYSFERVQANSFKQGDFKYDVQPYKYGDEAFTIKSTWTPKYTNSEGKSIVSQHDYNFIYDEKEKAIYSAYKHNNKLVRNDWGRIKNVSKQDWLEMIHNPSEYLIPWSDGAFLD